MKKLNLTITIVSCLLTLLACGEAQTENDEAKITGDVDFTVEQPSVEQADRVMATYCAGSGCHSSGSPNSAYVDDMALLRKNVSIVKVSVRSGSMPPNQVMPVGARQTLLNYLENMNSIAPQPAPESGQ